MLDKEFNCVFMCLLTSLKLYQQKEKEGTRLKKIDEQTIKQLVLLCSQVHCIYNWCIDAIYEQKVLCAKTLTY